ncbi:FAD/NAD(P)-binding domain-containing protein, partial [Aureobasidium melanogenum]
MQYYQDDWQAQQPEKKLKVIIVGTGIAGLTTAIGLKQSGHTPIVLEQVREIAEVAEIYKAPLGVIHRGDLQVTLLNFAQEQGCDIRTNSKVVKCDDNFEARVQLKDGSWIEGDLVVAADGIKSDLRRQIAAFHKHKDHSTPTGDAAYRILIEKERMEHDPEALELLSQNVGMRWMGPGGHIMAYPIKNNTVYNMVLLHPEHKDVDHEEEESWTRKGSKKEMMDFYKEWNSTVQRLLSYVHEDEVMEWTLNFHRPLPAWHEDKVVLIGDACHPMLPYVAQGAAQAIEDAGFLQTVLNKSSTDVTLAIQVYEQVRKARGEAVQSSASEVRKTLHLPDGSEQQERDEKIRAAGKGKGQNPDLWADRETQKWLWGTDIMNETLVKWPEWRARVSVAKSFYFPPYAFASESNFRWFPIIKFYQPTRPQELQYSTSNRTLLDFKVNSLGYLSDTFRYAAGEYLEVHAAQLHL